MNLTAITPTRDRPEAFALALRWMSNQTFKGQVQWIVVDDGDTPISAWPNAAFAIKSIMPFKPPNIIPLYLRRGPSSDPCTLQDNLLFAIPHVSGDGVVIWEDDEYYAPRYLEVMADMLSKAELVGEKNAHYYNVASRRWWLPDNQVHASLCRTGFRRALLPKLKEICIASKAANDVFVDLRLWGQKHNPPASKSIMLKPWSGLSVGIKGMPGRGGLGKSHELMAFPNADPDLKALRQWIKDDANEYERFCVANK